MDSTPYVEYLVRSHGYRGILLGTILEGETVLIIGGLCAKLGFLKLPVVMLAAFAGSFIGDQACFFLGYFRGRQILAGHPRWVKQADKVHNVMKAYRTPLMLCFRFIYGMRMIIPFVIGLDREVKVSKFIILNGIGAAVWSAVMAAGGYFFGYAMGSLMEEARRCQFIALLLVCSVAIGLWVFLRRRRGARCRDYETRAET